MAWNEFTYAGRALAKSPVFTVTAVLTIALGIGASTAIFSVTNAVLLRPLPYKDPAQLVIACGDMLKRNVKDFPFSQPDYIDLRNNAKGAFQDVGGVFTFVGGQPAADGTIEPVRTAVVTTNFFQMMGARIRAGRDFNATDGQPQPVPAAGANAAAAPARLPGIVILSYDYWQRRFAGSTAIFGQTTLAGSEIVGVLEPGFELLFPASANVDTRPEMWFANRLTYDVTQRNNVSMRIIGRLKPGTTIDRAQSESDLVSAEIDKGNAVKSGAGFHIRLVPLQKYLVEEVRPAILALMGAVIFLLLIASANVANLLLVRASLKERELAVRTALGGSAWRLVRQMLVEALLLAAAGTIIGIGLAWAGIHELLAIAPANLPRLDTIAIDPTVLVFSALTGLAAAALFGVVPAIRASRPDVIQALRASGRTAGLGGSGMLRNGVVIAEVALSFVLLIGSGLMFRSFLALQNINPGYDPHGLLTFQITGPRGQTPQERRAFMDNIDAKLKAVPGVKAATSSFPFPLTGNYSPIRWGKAEALSDNGKFQATDFQIIEPGYFAAMHAPLLEGREFTEADNVPNRMVVMIDQLLARKAFGDGPAVGQRLLTRVNTPEPIWVEVIGVVAHQRNVALAEAGREEMYFTDGYLGYGSVGTWAVRTSGDPGALTSAIREAVKSVNPHFSVNKVETMDSIMVKAQSGTRFSMLLIGMFATIAALLAGVGLYGVLATVVRQRTPEIGVRMAMGAAPANIFKLVVGQGMRLSLLGIVLGLAAAVAVTRVMTSMVVGVGVTDPLTYAAIVVVFLTIAAISCWVPARRAAGLDPNVALRDE
jgi:putative ABC transport system permease protein